MSFPTKYHLPLITNRLEFEFNSLPPAPQITTRRDLGAHIRRQARHNLAPYSRPRPREKTPVRARYNLESDSSLSDLSGSEEDTPKSLLELIPKPVGEAGKVNSGGFSLEKELGWNKKRFSEFTVNLFTKSCGMTLTLNRTMSRKKSTTNSTLSNASLTRS